MGRPRGPCLRRAQRGRGVSGDRRGRRSRRSIALSLRLPELGVGGRDRITYRAPAADPTDYVDRPIQIFTVHYMHVTMPSHASWVYDRGSPAAPGRPDRLEAGAARAGERATRPRRAADRGPRQREPGDLDRDLHRSRRARRDSTAARSRSSADRRDARVPIELEVFDFALPDENSMHAMLFYSSDQAGALSGPQSRSRLPSARASPSRGARARVRRADAAAARRPILRARTSRASAATKGPARASATCIAPRSSTGPDRDVRGSRERLGAQRCVDDVPPREGCRTRSRFSTCRTSRGRRSTRTS